jgi:hypothetical protein
MAPWLFLRIMTANMPLFLEGCHSVSDWGESEIPFKSILHCFDGDDRLPSPPRVLRSRYAPGGAGAF